MDKKIKKERETGMRETQRQRERGRERERVRERGVGLDR